MNDMLRDRFDELSERVEEAFAEVKPRLRGWLHLATAPLALAAGVVLVVLSPDATTRVGSGVFAATALVLFTVSAVYHRGTWSPTAHSRLRRFDHSNIFLLIAGSCTPFGLLLLDGNDRWAMLAIVWGGAVSGVVMKVYWLGAPRWLSVPIYMALGWAPVFFFGDFVSGAISRYGAATGTAVMVLVAAGGGLYTILAFVTHYVGVSLATYSLR